MARGRRAVGGLWLWLWLTVKPEVAQINVSCFWFCPRTLVCDRVLGDPPPTPQWGGGATNVSIGPPGAGDPWYGTALGGNYACRAAMECNISRVKWQLNGDFQLQFWM